MLKVTASGSFDRTQRFLNEMARKERYAVLERYGAIGVNALASATPYDSGLTAQSWSYEVVTKRGGYEIVWSNSNIQNGIQIAVILQYGHGTGTGGWVEGRDYINPAIQPLFDQIADEVWKQVTSA